MKIELNTWGRSRSCDFSLRLHGGAVFADFKIKRVHTVRLARISFDAFGFCRTEMMIRPMDVNDGKLLIAAVKTGNVDTKEVAALLRRYFSQNDGVIWRKALKEYGLLE
ncbi:MAG: hypothetical protein RL291_1845 [Pseudomonadota bacterium]